MCHDGACARSIVVSITIGGALGISTSFCAQADGELYVKWCLQHARCVPLRTCQAKGSGALQ